jgi:hypothetical protein
MTVNTEENRDPLDALMARVVPPLLRKSKDGSIWAVTLREALKVYPEGRERLKGRADDIEHWLRARRWTVGESRGRRAWWPPAGPTLAFVNLARCAADADAAAA